ncbi:hypothetical protein ACWEG1_27780 [Streptomyces bauhiniae]
MIGPTMTRTRRTAAVLAATTALLAAGATAPAVAQPEKAAATSCYGGAKSLTYRYSTAAVEYGTYTTTSRCSDINIKLSSSATGFLDACIVFVDHTTLCNHDNTYSTFGPQWATVATDVKDGTRFKLRVHAYDTDAQNVPFQLAF